jgi:hypothetical protein
MHERMGVPGHFYRGFAKSSAHALGARPSGRFNALRAIAKPLICEFASDDAA